MEDSKDKQSKGIEMQKLKKVSLLLKTVTFLLCSVLFFLLMKDVWIKYQSKTTTTGIRFEATEGENDHDHLRLRSQS